MANIKESMALAGMNPMVGGPHHGSFLVNVTNHDKDLGDNTFTGVSRSLDMDDNLYGIDAMGRFFAKKKYVVMDRKDIVEVYKINHPNCDIIMESIEKEASLPYDERPIHKPTYIYEVFTGHSMLTEDQMMYDPLLEKVNLEKMSSVLSGTTEGLSRQQNLQGKGNKNSDYIPDNDYPSGTENLASSGISLEASAEYYLKDHGYIDRMKHFMQNVKDKINYDILPGGEERRKNNDTENLRKITKLMEKKYGKKFRKEVDDVVSSPKVNIRSSHKGKTDKLSMHMSSPNADWKKKIQVKNSKNGHSESSVETYSSISEGFMGDALDYLNDKRLKFSKFVNDSFFKSIKNPLYRITDGTNKGSNKPYHADINYAFMDYLIDHNKELKNSRVSAQPKVYKNWWEQNKDKKVMFSTVSYPEKVQKNRVYFIDPYKRYIGIEVPIKLYELVAVTDISLLQEHMWETKGNDFKLLREISHMSYQLDGDTMYDLNESSDKRRFIGKTKIPYKCEVKNCYHTIKGPTKHPIPNLILHSEGKRWRVRSEILLFKEDKLFLHKQNKITQYDTFYKIPGGGIDDPKEYIENAAVRECEEEALIIPKNVEYSGVEVRKVYKIQPWWHKDVLNVDGIYYDGALTFICTGEYDKKYTKYVKVMDQDSIKNGHFYSYDEVKDLLTKEHRKLFKEYLIKHGYM